MCIYINVPLQNIYKYSKSYLSLKLDELNIHIHIQMAYSI